MGLFTATLAATNSVGSSTVSHPVVIECRDLDAGTIAGPTEGFPGVHTFTASCLPANATPPIAYLWDNGDVTAVSTRLLDVGTYTLTVTATNCLDVAVRGTHTIAPLRRSASLSICRRSLPPAAQGGARAKACRGPGGPSPHPHLSPYKRSPQQLHH